MDAVRKIADEQVALWNGPAGRAWADERAILDRMFKPFEELLVAAVPAGSGGRVLDVGCGTGATTLALAGRLGPAGHCVGIDLSEPMIAIARLRAQRDGASAQFLLGDAETYAFEPAGFDRIVSRFGVMFFDDPVAAFANLKRAAKADAELRVAVWRSPAENPFMTTAERTAAPLLPAAPARRPDAPGQFALADPDLVRRILEGSGWRDVEIDPVDLDCSFPEASLVPFLSRLGPLGLFLSTADQPTRARIVETVRPAFESYVRGGEVRFTAACWTVGARAASADTNSR